MTGSLAFGPGALRLLLAVLVFVSHTSGFNIGRAAVIVFFMLSGYWVTRLYDQRDEPSVVGYLRDRFFRVWPLLAVVAAALVVISIAARRPYHGSLVSTLALLGLGTRHGDVIGVAWSLDVEMQFYVLLPFALAGLAAARVAAAIALVAAATLAGAVLLEREIVTVLAYAPAFAAGAAIWLLRWSPPVRTAARSVVAFVGLAGLVVASPAFDWLLLGKAFMPWYFDLVQMVLCAVLVPFVAWNVHQPSPPLDRHLGNLSYPFYLVHYPIVAACAGLTGTATIDKGLAFALSSIATLILYLGVDRRCEKLRKAATRPRESPGFDASYRDL